MLFDRYIATRSHSRITFIRDSAFKQRSQFVVKQGGTDHLTINIGFRLGMELNQ